MIRSKEYIINRILEILFTGETSLSHFCFESAQIDDKVCPFSLMVSREAGSRTISDINILPCPLQKDTAVLRGAVSQISLFFAKSVYLFSNMCKHCFFKRYILLIVAREKAEE